MNNILINLITTILNSIFRIVEIVFAIWLSKKLFFKKNKSLGGDLH